jgi:hypothetical protein
VADEPEPRVLHLGEDRRSRIVVGAIIHQDAFPITKALIEKALEALPDKFLRLVVTGDHDRNGRRVTHA